MPASARSSTPGQHQPTSSSVDQQFRAMLYSSTTAGVCCHAPSLASCLAMASFSLEVRVQPGDCSPSRSVVSKMRTCGPAAEQRNCETTKCATCSIKPSTLQLWLRAWSADCDRAVHETHAPPWAHVRRVGNVVRHVGWSRRVQLLGWGPLQGGAVQTKPSVSATISAPVGRRRQRSSAAGTPRAPRPAAKLQQPHVRETHLGTLGSGCLRPARRRSPEGPPCCWPSDRPHRAVHRVLHVAAVVFAAQKALAELRPARAPGVQRRAQPLVCRASSWPYRRYKEAVSCLPCVQGRVASAPCAAGQAGRRRRQLRKVTLQAFISGPCMHSARRHPPTRFNLPMHQSSCSMQHLTNAGGTGGWRSGDNCKRSALHRLSLRCKCRNSGVDAILHCCP